MIDHKTFAANTLKLLQPKPLRYRNFGPYWYLVKSLLKRFYTADNLYLLGDYQDPAVIARMPVHETYDEALAAAAEEYRENAVNNLDRNEFVDDDGEVYTLFDGDAEL